MFSRWTNQGSHKKLPRTISQYLKSYYFIKADGKSNNVFKKWVYFRVETPDEVCIISVMSLSQNHPLMGTNDDDELEFNDASTLLGH